MMSKYTTEVRFICETFAGYSESQGSSKIDEVIDKSWNKVITSNFDIFDETYRRILVSKVLKHFYLREICSETVGIWQFWMNTKFEEVMPYYNQLYESTKLKFDPLIDVDVTTTRTGNTDTNKNGSENTITSGKSTANINSTRKDDNSVTSTSSETSSNENTNYNLFSDTPQGALTGVNNEKYLTDARKTTDNGKNNINRNATNKEVDSTDLSETNTSSQTNDTNKTSSDVINSTEKYVETIKGKRNGENFSDLLVKYRDSLINIDMMVITEFEDLFLKLW